MQRTLAVLLSFSLGLAAISLLNGPSQPPEEPMVSHPDPEVNATQAPESVALETPNSIGSRELGVLSSKLGDGRPDHGTPTFTSGSYKPWMESEWWAPRNGWNDYPIALGPVERYESDPYFNPSGIELTDEQRTELTETIGVWDAAYIQEQHSRNLGVLEFASSRLKEESRFYSGGSTALVELRKTISPEQAMLLPFSGPGLKQGSLIVIYPGEVPEVETAISNSWYLVESANDEIMSYFAAISADS
jgi:hypothetical protein